MKRDPHKQPIPLTGSWKYTVGRKQKPLEGSFWWVSSRLMFYRKANRLKGQSLEQCQMDVLKSRRTELGLTSELVQPVPVMSPIQQFVKNRGVLPKRTGGCRGCGKKRH